MRIITSLKGEMTHEEMTLKIKGLIALAAMSLPAMIHASAIYITTGHTGAQTQMDVSHHSEFVAPSISLTCSITQCNPETITYFDPTFNWDLAGGDFEMKKGTATTDDVTFSFYDSVDGLIASVMLHESDFCTLHGGNCQSFALTKFDFSKGPITLRAGHHYYGILSSNAVDAQSTAYFIKGLDSMGFTPNAPTDPNSNNPPNSNPPTNNATPEPGSIWTMIGGAASIVVFRRRK